MHSLLIIGAGSFATEVEELAHLLGYDDISFLDDNPERACCSPVIGKCSQIPEMREKYDTAVVALGSNEDRMKYHKILKESRYNIPVLIHPTAYVSPDAELSPGTIIRAKAVVSRYVKIGEACIINVGALIDHHVVIEEGSHILMGAVVRNKATIKSMSWVKSNDVVE